MADDVTVENNIPQFRELFRRAILQAAEVIGGKAETYAKGLAPNWGGVLRNSITHHVMTDLLSSHPVILIGSPMEIAAYAEVGTAIFYEPPADFIDNIVPEGKHHYGSQGIGRWWFYDPISHVFRVGTAQHASHFLEHAITDHLTEYAADVEAALRHA